jgi:hypothetical protein
VAGVLFVVVSVVGRYVVPDLVYPEEQIGGVQRTFYVNYEDRLLAQAILFGVASVLWLVFVGGLRAFLAGPRARMRGWPRWCWPPGGGRRAGVAAGRHRGGVDGAARQRGRRPRRGQPMGGTGAV